MKKSLRLCRNARPCLWMRSDTKSKFKFLTCCQSDIELYLFSMMYSSKNRNRVASIFLFAYLMFVVTNAIHFHQCSLLLDQSYLANSQNTSAQNHFLSNNPTICVIHQFSNSILDLKFTNSVSCCTNGFQNLTSVVYAELIPNFFLKINSNRAPPTFS